MESKTQLRNLLQQQLDGDDAAISVADDLVSQVLMQRDCHFGGSFDLMLAAYRAGGKSVAHDLTVRDVERVAAMEKETGGNLAATLLSGEQMEQVAQARSTYRDLQALYESAKPGSLELAMADLILSESMEPEQEIAAVIAHGTPARLLLCNLLESAVFSSPLFPGYGYAPMHAAAALGKLGDTAAIATLFGAMHRTDEPATEEACVQALTRIGDPALQFLLRRVAARPLTTENETAAYALSCWPADPSIATVAQRLLEDPEVQRRPLLSDYLRLLVN